MGPLIIIATILDALKRETEKAIFNKQIQSVGSKIEFKLVQISAALR